MSSTQLSICIATLNRAAFIGQTLDSIIRQATDEMEIVIVDGASSDNTKEIVEHYQRQFPRLRYPIANITSTWLVAIDKQHLLMAVLIAAGLFSLLMDYILLWAGYGVLGVALGTVVGYSLYGLGYMVLAVHLAFGQEADTACFLARLVMPFVVMVLAIVAAGVLIEDGQAPLGYVLAAAKRLALVMSVLLPVLWLVNRDGELVRAVRGMSHT